MDTNQESGVSLQDVADLLEQDEQVTDESGEQEGAEEVAQSDDSEAPEEQPEEGDDDEEMVEVEGKNGKKFKIPKEIADERLMQADYTRKTQEVAEQKRLNLEEKRVLEERKQLEAHSFDKRVEVRGIQRQLDQFNGIDWQSLARDDPARATELHITYQQLQQELARKAGEVQQIETQAQQLSEQQRQQRLRSEGAELLKHIPDFKKHEAKVVETAKHFGYTDEELHAISVLNPDSRALRVLHAAAQWIALQEAKPKAMQKVAEAPRVVKPEAPRPKSEQRTRELNTRFNSGRAKLGDLAAFLENS